jgi:hypothetical protein
LAILVLGCGGTGGWLAPKLIKIFNDARRKGLTDDVNIIFADGDHVEEKNLIRQNFIAADVGKNKAEVIAARYGQHVVPGVSVGFFDKYVVDNNYSMPKEDADKFVLLSDVEKALLHHVSKSSGILVINLIDNAKTRKMIHSWAAIRSHKAGVYVSIIDVANNSYNGQLNFTDYSVKTLSGYLSRFYVQHPDHLDDDDDISLYNCADADANAVDQLFNANDMAATVTSNFINHWCANGEFKYGQIKFVTGSAPSIENSCPMYTNFFMPTGVSAGLFSKIEDQTEYLSLKGAYDRLWRNESKSKYFEFLSRSMGEESSSRFIGVS